MKLQTGVYIGIVASIVSTLAFTLVFGVSIYDILAVGPIAFILASSVSVLRLVVQGIRFHVLAKGINGNASLRVGESTVARMAAEFTDLVIPSYAGGEVVKIPWLLKRGLNTGQALLVVYVEVLFDVIIGGAISIIAALYLVTQGAYSASTILFVLSSLWIGFFVAVPWFVSRGMRSFPKLLIGYFSRIIGAKRVESVLGSLDRAAVQSSEAARTFVKTSPKNVLVESFLLTFAMVVLAGMVFWIVAIGSGLHFDLFTSILGVYVSYTIGAIPITPGGSGLAEGGLGLFVSSIYTGQLWPAVIVWRIISYHIPLAITGLAVLYLSRLELANLSFNQDIRTHS